MTLLRSVASLAVGLSFFAIGCAAPAEEQDASNGDSAFSAGNTPNAETPPFTFFLSLDDDTPQRRLVTGGAPITLTARDPNPAEVEEQSDMGAATVKIGELAIRTVPGTKPTTLDVEVRYSAAGNGALEVVRPTSSDLSRLMRSGVEYELSATRTSETTSKFFSEVDLTFTPRR